MERNFNTNNLSYSGGCAMNSLATVKFYKIQNIEIYQFTLLLMTLRIAIGAAAYAYLKYYKKIIIKSNYLGPSYSNVKLKIL